MTTLETPAVDLTGSATGSVSPSAIESNAPFTGNITPPLSLSNSVTPWFILTYPMQMLQSRLLCARYLSLITIPVFPDYDDEGNLSISGAGESFSCAAKNGSIIPVMLRQPLLLAACSTGAVNIFSMLSRATKIVYDAEGVPGLFRGLVPSCCHRLCRDFVHWTIARFCFPVIASVSRYIVSAVALIAWPLKRRDQAQWQLSLENSMDRLELTDGIVGVGSVKEMTTEINRSSENIVNSQQQQSLRYRLETELIPPMLIKLTAEIICYPILVVASRLAVIEAPYNMSASCGSAVYLPNSWSLSSIFGFIIELYSANLVVGCIDMCYLTYKLDGASGFWRGALPHVLSRSVDEAVTAITFFSNRCSPPKKELVDQICIDSTQQLTNREDSCLLERREDRAADPLSVDSRLQQLEDYTTRAWLSAILGTAAAPLAQLSVIQRCQSRVEGLCEYRPWLSLLAGMPWKPLMLQFGVCCVFLALSEAVLASSQQRAVNMHDEDEAL